MKNNTNIKDHWWILICLGIAGLTLVIVGSISKDSTAIVAIGGALLGGSIGSVIAKYDGYLFQEKTLNIIQATLTNKFISNEDIICRFRKEWHVYYSTKVNGNYNWRYVIWDLKTQKGLGVLSGSFVTYDHDGNEHEYFIEAGIRDQRLIAIDKFPDSTEPCSIVIMPFMGESFHQEHYGIKLLKTWDASDSICPIIVSSTPLEFIDKRGSITDNKNMKNLTKMWKDNFYRLNEMNI